LIKKDEDVETHRIKSLTTADACIVSACVYVIRRKDNHLNGDG
jgi:hypothetical protein